MRTIQDKVLDKLKWVVETHGLEPLAQFSYNNVGYISIEDPHEFGSLGKIYFDFQSDRMMLSLSFRGKPVLSQPPREGYYDFYMSYSDTKLYNKFITALEQGLKTL